MYKVNTNKFEKQTVKYGFSQEFGIHGIGFKDLGFKASGSRVRIQGFGFRDSDSGFKDSDSGFEDSTVTFFGFRIRILGFVRLLFRIISDSGFGFSGCFFRIHGFKDSDSPVALLKKGGESWPLLVPRQL